MGIFKRNIFKRLLLVALFGTSMLVTGCASQKEFRPLLGNINNADIKEVHFSKPFVVPTAFEVEDPEDPVQLIKGGICLSKRGKAASAAELFQMASSVPAPDNHLEVHTMFASANEYLKQGDVTSFINTMKDLDKSLSRFQRVSLTDQEATLMALYDLSQGEAYSSSRHPEAVRELFK